MGVQLLVGCVWMIRWVEECKHIGVVVAVKKVKRIDILNLDGLHSLPPGKHRWQEGCQFFLLG